MKKRFFYNFLISIILISFFAWKADAQNIQVEAKLDQGTIRIGDQTKLRFVVRQTAKEHVNFPKLADTIIGKVQIVNSSKLDTAYDKNHHDLLTITQNYTITSFDAGTYSIPSFSFGSVGGVIKTTGLILQVQSVKVDTTKAIYDIKQPFVVSYTFFDWLRDNWIWVILTLLVVISVIGLIWYLKKRPKPENPIIKDVKPVIPAHTLALTKLNQLRDKKLWQQDEVKQYYSELSDIIREYLERRYMIKTQERTTDEIFGGLKYLDIIEKNREKLRQILTLADLVKFAKEKPLPIDNEHSMDNAISFVNNTQQMSGTSPYTEGGIADEGV